YSLPSTAAGTGTAIAMNYVNGIGIAGTKQGELYYLSGGHWTLINQFGNTNQPITAIAGDAYGTDLYVGRGHMVCHMVVSDITAIESAANEKVCSSLPLGNVLSFDLSGTNLAARTD